MEIALGVCAVCNTGTSSYPHRLASIGASAQLASGARRGSGTIGQYHRSDKTSNGVAMRDYQASIEKLRKDAAEAALIRDLATDKTKREMFGRPHEHLNRLADEVEQAMASGKEKK
jgi:hypothetical protein